MSDIKKLRKAFEDAEAEAHDLSNEYDSLKKGWREKIRKAADKAAAAQREWLHAEAGEALAARRDADVEEAADEAEAAQIRRDYEVLASSRDLPLPR